LSVRLRSDATNAPKAIFRAMVSSAQRGKGFLVAATPVDRGILRNAWKIVKSSATNEVQLVNDQPYAGVMERGARPFKMGRAGIEAIKGWVGRQLRAGKIILKPKPRNAIAHLTDAYKVRFKSRPKLSKGAERQQAIESITWAIVKTIEKVGIKGRRFVMNNLDKLAALMKEEMDRSLDNFFSRALGDKE